MLVASQQGLPHIQSQEIMVYRDRHLERLTQELVGLEKLDLVILCF